MFLLSKDNIKKLFWVFLFSVSFGYLESAVVVYLRELFYPSGFKINIDLGFPYIQFGMVQSIQYIPLKLLLVEVGREASTILILISLAYISGKKIVQRLGFFLFAFGMWDIFYYLFLKLLINWPESLSTLDVLFLIPVPWIAPVWLPFSISIIFVGVSLFLIKEEKGLSAF